MEWEGKKKNHFYCFSVVDRSGLSLMRMSTSDANDAAVWVQVCRLFLLTVLHIRLRTTNMVSKTPHSYICKAAWQSQACSTSRLGLISTGNV